jgi:phosphatidylglycerol:prolipoprotein diacylglycerol transferase
MHPILFKVGPFAIHTYGVFVTLGFLLGLSSFLYADRKRNLEEGKMLSLSLGVVASGIVGARIFYVLDQFYWYFEHPQDILRIWQGGLVFYGGFLFSLITGLYLIRRYRLAFWEIADISAPALALGMSIGRIGCFFNGCCYGKPWKWGLVFSPDSPAGTLFPNQPLFPTQLIASANLLVIFFILGVLRSRQNFTDRVFLWFLILYSVHRFLIEFIRADYPEILFHLTVPQFISIILGISSLVLMKRRYG